MSYTIISAAYANPQQTAAVVVTQEAGPVLLSETDTPADWAAMLARGIPKPFTQFVLAADVDAERDRRTADKFVFQDHAIQLDDTSLLNITAMGASAKFAVLAGAAAGNLRWSDPNADFGWIGTDNNVIPMDAPTMSAMADAAKAWVSANIFAGRALKSQSPIPTDYAADSHWPTSG